jgi:hypothetical protein
MNTGQAANLPRILSRCSKSRKLVRRVTIKIFAPYNVHYHKRIILAPGGNHFTEEGIDKILEDTAAEIERRIPGYEYELVEIIEGAHFNFVCRGERDALKAAPANA